MITEPDLLTIERYRENSEKEKANWLLQVSELRALESRRKIESENLNRQLSQAREQNRTLQQSYEKSEAEKLILISLKNGEIAGLKEEVAEEKMRLQKSRSLNVILGGILGLIAVLAAVFVYVKVRTGGLKALKLFG